MLDMGITSPVTRENAGGAYYQQLARQLAEFLGAYMPRNGGIMTLSDIYCMFNRARGVELVSPDDVYYAAMLQQKLKLGYHVRKFDGGLIVLQSGTWMPHRAVFRRQLALQRSCSRQPSMLCVCLSYRFPSRRPGRRSLVEHGDEVEHGVCDEFGCLDRTAHVVPARMGVLESRGEPGQAMSRRHV